MAAKSYNQYEEDRMTYFCPDDRTAVQVIASELVRLNDNMERVIKALCAIYSK